MLFRIVSFLLFQIIGASLGWWVGQMPGALVATVVSAWCWFVSDLWRGRKMLYWLKEGNVDQAPHLLGLWGEATDRARRLLRLHEKNAQQAVAQLQQVLTALQASPNGVVLLDAQGHIEWCNQTACEHFGFDLERDHMQVISNLVRAPEFNAYFAANDFSKDVVLTSPVVRATSPLKISVQMFPYEGNRKLLLSRDVTSVELADAMRRDFVANVSHEIRTPLTVLMGFIETLQTLPLSSEERTLYLGLMSNQSQRMQSLVADLLTLSRLEGNPPPSLIEWVSVGGLIRRTEEDAQALSNMIAKDGDKALTLHFPTVASDACTYELAGAGNELQSALSNLVNNAVRYTPAGGEITVEFVRQSDGSGRFSVADTGPGIAPEHIPRLTERFYRLDRSRSRDTGGTGLGLAIVKHVLQRHGAQLQIRSTLGKGSEFVVIFPPSRVRKMEAEVLD
ncbi:MAG: phosphate regulon sensor histidine kinase PhoR [Comamonas sp.]